MQDLSILKLATTKGRHSGGSEHKEQLGNLGLYLSWAVHASSNNAFGNLAVLPACTMYTHTYTFPNNTPNNLGLHLQWASSTPPYKTNEIRVSLHKNDQT